MTQTSTFKYRIIRDKDGMFKAQKRFGPFWYTLDTRLFESGAHETIKANRQGTRPHNLVWTGD